MTDDMGTIKARPTMYNGIRMRSRLEARWAAHFDQQGLTWNYEPHCFATSDGQYLPDFEIEHPYGRQEFVEIKGVLAHEDRGAVLRRMRIILASAADPYLTLVVGQPSCYVAFGAGPYGVGPSWCQEVDWGGIWTTVIDWLDTWPVDTPDTRATLAARALDYSLGHPDEHVRYALLVRIAERCRVTPAQLQALTP